MPVDSYRTSDSESLAPHTATHASADASCMAAASSVSVLAHDVVDMDSELLYWRGEYRVLVDRPGLRYSDYEPAVKLGLDAYMRSHGRDFREMEDDLIRCYKRVRGVSKLDWDEARPMVQAAWHRLEQRDRLRPRGGHHA